MRKKIVIYVPYPGKMNKFHENMISILQRKYNVIGIRQALINPILLFRAKKIYFSHIENTNWGLKWKFAFKMVKMAHMEVNYFFHNFMKYETENREEAFEKVKYMVHWADNVYILSTGGREILKKYYGVTDDEKIKYIDHINYINSYSESAKNYRLELHIPEDVLLMGFFGYLRPYKNIELLIETFNSMKLADNIHLLIAGSPLNKEYGDKIAELCRNNARIHLSLGQIPDEELSSLFKALDIVIMPYNVTKNMNSGVMVAAFSYKRTVLVSNTEMAKDFNKQGFLYMYDGTANEKDNFSQALQKVIADGREHLRVKGQAAYEYVRINNSPEHVLEQLEK